MVLSGWNQAPSVEINGKKSVDGSGSSSAAAESNNAEEILPGKKRKYPEATGDGNPNNAVSSEAAKGKKKLEVLGDDDNDIDCVAIDVADFNSATANKKTRQQ